MLIYEKFFTRFSLLILLSLYISNSLLKFWNFFSLRLNLRRIKDLNILGENSMDLRIRYLSLLHIYRKKGKAEFLREALDLSRKLVKKFFNNDLYNSQIQAALGLFEGAAVELNTGEGKTLSILVAAILSSSLGRKVMIVTVNDYLVRRDYELSSSLWGYLNVRSVPVLESTENLRKAYENQVVYVNNQKLIFDYLQGLGSAEGVPFSFEVHVIYDELDLVLFDNALIPFITSDSAEIPFDPLLDQARQIFFNFSRNLHYISEPDHIEILDYGYQTVEEILLERGIIDKAQELYEFPNNKILIFLNDFIKGYFHLTRDVHYIVKDNKILILNELTGRIDEDRSFVYPLNKVIEFKEDVAFNENQRVLTELNYHHFFNSFRFKSGTSGTLRECSRELWNCYRIPFLPVEAHFKSKRRHEGDLILKTLDQSIFESWRNLKRLHRKGAPVLMVASDMVSLNSFENFVNKIDPELNYQRIDALRASKEEFLIARVGLPGQITLSNNITGRGTDILIGGDHRFLKARKSSHKAKIQWLRIKNGQWKKEVNKLGGLNVLLLGLNASTRIDRQAFGRAARQGLNGVSISVSSLQDQNCKQLNLGSKFLAISQELLPSVLLKGFLQKLQEKVSAFERRSLFREGFVIQRYYKNFSELGRWVRQVATMVEFMQLDLLYRFLLMGFSLFNVYPRNSLRYRSHLILSKMNFKSDLGYVKILRNLELILERFRMEFGEFYIYLQDFKSYLNVHSSLVDPVKPLNFFVDRAIANAVGRIFEEVLTSIYVLPNLYLLKDDFVLFNLENRGNFQTALDPS